MARRRATSSVSRKQLQLRFDHALIDAASRDAFQTGSWRGRKVHFIGIGGIGMSGIASLLLSEGAVVSGCDAMASDLTEGLARSGIQIAIGHSPSHIAEGTDLLVISAAVRETNPELRAAKRRGVPVLKYAQALGHIMSNRDGIAVSGSHGKTTTASMIAYTLNIAGRNPSMVVGGLVPQLGGNSFNGGTGPFVVEACEYDRSFLNFSPKAAVITNIDRDHLDYYTGFDDIVDAFGSFAMRVSPDGVVVVNGDDPHAVKAAERSTAQVETVGQGERCAWRIGNWSRSGGKTSFRLLHNGRDLGEWSLIVPGLYNIYNALSCVAVCNFFGVKLKEIRDALAEFRGARRRFDRLGEVGGVVILDDYGHHPTEVRVTLDAARQEFPTRRLWCVFQPHQCSRTRLLLEDFAQSFRSADHVIVPDIYSVRDTKEDRSSIHARDLVERLRLNGVRAEYGSRLPQTVKRLLANVRSGDIVMTMGAGPVGNVGHDLLKELQRREHAEEMVLRS